MLSRNELKYIQSLCQKKQREAERLFLAEGVKLVEELLHSEFSVRHIYALDSWQEQQSTVPVTRITEAELQKISNLQTPNQVLAIVAQPDPGPLPTLEGQLSLVLDGIQDPGNLGTIIRIADWFGITQIIASTDTVEWFNPKVVQATMGSIIRVKSWYLDLPEFLQQVSVPVWGALLAGENVYTTAPISEGLLVIGNESKGIRAPILPLIQHPVTIPRKGQAESLNAGVATGILLSHLAR